MKLLVSFAALVLLGGVARSQAVNINIIGPSQPGGPNSSYGGAIGQAGKWNMFSGTTTFGALIDTQGNTTLAYMKNTGGNDNFFDNPLTNGDDESLLDNYVDTGGPGKIYAFALRSLALGDYLVITYAWSPDDPVNDVTIVSCSNSTDPPQKVGGQDWGGAHKLGVTYAAHRVTVTGTDSFDLTIEAGSGEGRFCGVQIMPVKPVTKFCTAKSGLACGLPAIDALGNPSATAGSGFIVSAGPARTCKAGILVYNTAQAATPLPFQGGLLCVESMGARRAGPTDSMGTPGGANCDGEFALDMNKFAVGNWVVPDCAGAPAGIPANNPAAFLTVSGTAVFAQFWGRDSVATGSFVSDGVAWVVGP